MVDQRRFGIPAHSPFVDVPLMASDVIPGLIIKQKMSFKGHIEKVTPDGVIFRNGEQIKGRIILSYLAQCTPTWYPAKLYFKGIG